MKNLSYVPINFSNIPRVLTEHIHVNTVQRIGRSI
jgi:hypothetical protein